MDQTCDEDDGDNPNDEDLHSLPEDDVETLPHHVETLPHHVETLPHHVETLPHHVDKEKENLNEKQRTEETPTGHEMQGDGGDHRAGGHLQQDPDCPGCGADTASFSQKLLTDKCGHRKCAKCLVVEESSCSQCQIENVPENMLDIVANKMPQQYHNEGEEGSQVELVTNTGDISTAVHEVLQPSSITSSQDKQALHATDLVSAAGDSLVVPRSLPVSLSEQVFITLPVNAATNSVVIPLTSPIITESGTSAAVSSSEATFSAPVSTILLMTEASNLFTTSSATMSASFVSASDLPKFSLVSTVTLPQVSDVQSSNSYTIARPSVAGSNDFVPSKGHLSDFNVLDAVIPSGPQIKAIETVTQTSAIRSTSTILTQRKFPTSTNVLQLDPPSSSKGPIMDSKHVDEPEVVIRPSQQENTLRTVMSTPPQQQQRKSVIVATPGYTPLKSAAAVTDRSRAASSNALPSPVAETRAAHHAPTKSVRFEDMEQNLLNEIMRERGVSARQRDGHVGRQFDHDDDNVGDAEAVYDNDGGGGHDSGELSPEPSAAPAFDTVVCHQSYGEVEAKQSLPHGRGMEQQLFNELKEHFQNPEEFYPTSSNGEEENSRIKFVPEKMMEKGKLDRLRRWLQNAVPDPEPHYDESLLFQPKVQSLTSDSQAISRRGMIEDAELFESLDNEDEDFDEEEDYNIIADKNHQKVIERGKEVSITFQREIENALEVDEDNTLVLPDHITVEDEGILACTFCNKKFEMSQFRKHLDCHKKEKSVTKYGCTACDKQFLTSSHLTYHIRSVHTGERPYKCILCPMSFLQIVKLKRHILTHTGEKPFNCDICNKSFRTNYHLKEHRNIHIVSSHHRCPSCDKSFADSNNLRRHIKNLHGKRKVSCKKCKQSFESKYELLEHKSEEHGIQIPSQRSKCDECGRFFNSRGSLEKHKMSHTDDSQHLRPRGQQYDNSPSVGDVEESDDANVYPGQSRQFTNFGSTHGVLKVDRFSTNPEPCRVMSAVPSRRRPVLQQEFDQNLDLSVPAAIPCPFRPPPDHLLIADAKPEPRSQQRVPGGNEEDYRLLDPKPGGSGQASAARSPPVPGRSTGGGRFRPENLCVSRAGDFEEFSNARQLPGRRTEDALADNPKVKPERPVSGRASFQVEKRVTMVSKEVSRVFSTPPHMPDYLVNRQHDFIERTNPPEKWTAVEESYRNQSPRMAYSAETPNSFSDDRRVINSRNPSEPASSFIDSEHASYTSPGTSRVISSFTEEKRDTNRDAEVRSRSILNWRGQRQDEDRLYETEEHASASSSIGVGLLPDRTGGQVSRLAGGGEREGGRGGESGESGGGERGGPLSSSPGQSDSFIRPGQRQRPGRWKGAGGARVILPSVHSLPSLTPLNSPNDRFQGPGEYTDNSFDRSSEHEERIKNLNIQEKTILKKLFEENRLEVPSEFQDIGDQDNFVTGGQEVAGPSNPSKKRFLKRYRNESGYQPKDAVDEETLMCLKETSKLLLSSNSIHIKLTKEQEKNFIYSMLKILKSSNH